MVKLATVLLLIITLLSPVSAYADDTTIEVASSSSITTASISAIAPASSASQTVSYKYYDKPWLMEPPPQELTQNEYEIGKPLQEVNDKLPIIASSPYQAKLEAMINTIVIVTPRPHLEYTVKIIDKPEINAYVMPTGSIYVYMGLLNKIESDDELAGVLAHEIAHNVRFHITQKIEENMVTTINWYAGKLVKIGGIITLNPNLYELGTFIDATATAILSQINIPQEDEADKCGYEYIKKTHYSPVGLLVFLEKMAAWQGGNEKEMGIYMDHSLSLDRVSTLKKYMEQDGINIIAEKRKVLKISNVGVKEIKPGSTTAAYKVVYNKINIISFTHTDANKVKATKLAENINQILNNSGEAYQLRIKNTGKTRKIYYKDTLLCAFSDKDLIDTTGGADIVLQKLKQVIRDDSITAHRTDI